MGSWQQRGNDIVGESPSSLSGSSIDLDSVGNIIGIGSYNHSTIINPSQVYEGQIEIYEWSNASGWVQKGSDIEGKISYGNFGRKIDLNNDGTKFITSSTGTSVNGPEGVVYVYSFDTLTNTYNLLGDSIVGQVPGDNIGRSVSISNDGQIIAIGTPDCDINPLDTIYDYTGRVSVYRWNSNSWIKSVDDIDGQNINDYFGFSTSISADNSKLIAGAYLNDDNGIESGHARVYSLNIPCSSGCTDSLALNYDPNAVVDDGSCSYCNNDTTFVSVSSCDSYTWGDSIYTQSGTYYSNIQLNNNYSMSFDGVDDSIAFISNTFYIFIILLLYKKVQLLFCCF